MKKVCYVLFFAFYVPVLFLFRPRQDIIFAAINESHYIGLFENGNEFKLCIKDKNSYRGTFTISRDTVFLWSMEQLEPAPPVTNVDLREGQASIPVMLLINTSSSKIESINSELFSAEIYLDERQKLNKPQPDLPGRWRTQIVKLLASKP